MITKKEAIEVAETLLPCPFCGVEPEVLIRGAGEYAKNPKARCRTEECAGASLPVVCIDVPEQVEAWNRRDNTEIEKLRLAEEGAKEAFSVIVQDKRNLEAKCKQLQKLLDGAYDIIRRNAKKA